MHQIANDRQSRYNLNSDQIDQDVITLAKWLMTQRGKSIFNCRLYTMIAVPAWANIFLIAIFVGCKAILPRSDEFQDEADWQPLCEDSTLMLLIERCARHTKKQTFYILHIHCRFNDSHRYDCHSYVKARNYGCYEFANHTWWWDYYQMSVHNTKNIHALSTLLTKVLSAAILPASDEKRVHVDALRVRPRRNFLNKNIRVPLLGSHSRRYPTKHPTID